MKLLCIILSFYVILLSVRPCCADDCSGDAPATEKTQAKSRPDKKDCSACSPFYRCGGCAGFTVVTQATSVEPVTISTDITYTVYRQTVVKDVSRAIWQPPQWS